MQGDVRRSAILELLNAMSGPVSAAALAKDLSVSRQIIVGDIALLRASGVNISATPRGYVILRETGGLLRTIACQHTAGQIGAELNAIVDQGCIVVDVVVEHPVYGQLTGPLQISNRYEVEQFVLRVDAEQAEPLSRLTQGIHLHTVSCPDEAAYGRVCERLRREGFLLESLEQNEKDI